MTERQATHAPPLAHPSRPQNDTARAADTGTPASAYGLLAGEAGFVARLGAGLRLSAEDLQAGRINLQDRAQPIPGVRLKSASYSARRQRVDLTADLAVPHLAEGEFTIRVDSTGAASLTARLRRDLEIPALGNPSVTVTLDEEGRIGGEVTVEGANLIPRRPRIPGLTAEASGTLTLSDGKVSGNGSATLTYADLGNGTVNFRFTEEGRFSADGTVTITPPFLDQIETQVAIDEDQNLTAHLELQAGQMATSIPGLSVTGGTLTLDYENSRVSASIAGFAASYANFGSLAIDSAALDRANKFSARGAISLDVPMMDEVTGQVRVRSGAVSGSLTIASSAFPDGFPVRNGSITATMDEAGRLGMSGEVGVDLGPAGDAQLSASYGTDGQFDMGVDAQITIPGLQPGQVNVAYGDGQLSGEAQIPIDTALLPGLDGSVTVRYRENRWSGETTISYSADNGKLSGSITVTVAQTEEGALELGGEGAVTAQLMPRLSGTLTATILPEGGIDVSGAIEVTEPLELFPEKRMDRELFRYSQNIPLWAMLVAVLRVRAGVRAGVGPAVFRNIRVEGSYTIGSEEADPSFSVAGELFVPAFVEGYVALGAGLGVDVVLGSLTGGIEAVGTAGLYGAISVVPTLNYADGDWGIEGVATLAAGARVKLGLNAWAEIEALWVTVWEQEWQLAEAVFPMGPDLALQARMNYTFGQAEPPEIEMSSTDIDASALIQEAMPKDGPAGSGAREALQNRAEWRGQLQEQSRAAVPPETAAQAQAPTPAPPAPARPQRAAPPADAARQGQAGQGGAGQAPTQPTVQSGSANQQQRSDAVDEAARAQGTQQAAVPEGSLPNSDTPRYPRPLTLATLDEPPAPQPRTASDEREDVNAAKRLVELASAQSTTSDALDDYFPRIKRRFGLTTLGFKGDFQRGFEVVGGINPDLKVTVREPLSGTGIPSDSSNRHRTKVTMEGGNLGGDTVGIHMLADPLGPDHPQGSGPGGQAGLMGMLPTDPKTYADANQRYIRGHLLNDNLGGPGRPVNLYPITAHANSVHHAAIERDVKTWVNDRRYWVRYEVTIRGGDTILETANGIKYVNSTMEAQASVLDTRLDPVSGLTRSVSIRSEYDTAAAVTTDENVDAAALDAHTGRAIDQGVDVQLSSRHGGGPTVTFPGEIETLLKAKIAARGRAWVAARLRSYSGFGERSEAVLFKAYDAVKRRSDKTVDALNGDEVGVFTRIRNSWSQPGGGLKDTL
ncbi:DNA/RNA non-specific endonuclease [Meridianimarinicoccus sp. RP-17]|uniref:DNA/RNA non-specific endonuclease n=1 Tax=Meridianimarinicoccus zhengii TaxID=2056810 RepID=UPI001F47791A|nr:DNA/RNA non-specific endonuclease [Phycocomes zhengii]